MMIAFATSITLLPALIVALKPAEPDPIGFAALPPSTASTRWRFWINGATLTATLLWRSASFVAI